MPRCMPRFRALLQALLQGLASWLFTHCERSASGNSTMRTLPDRTPCVYIVCVSRSAIITRMANLKFAMRNAVPNIYKIAGTRIAGSSCGRAMMPPRRFIGGTGFDDEIPQKIALRHVMCARFAPSLACAASCPLHVAEAPHKVAGLEGAGIFLSLQGNDMAKCQRTKLDTARSLHSAFCSVGNVILRAMYDLSSSTGSQ